MSPGYVFEAVLYRWEARKADTWTFVDLPEPLADEIEEAGSAVARGFGSLRVDVRVGTTTWRTSIFPTDTTYVLPIKKAIRRAESLTIGDTLHIHLTLVDVPA